MTTTTPPGVASAAVAAPATAAPAATAPVDTVDQFQSLWDADVAAQSGQTPPAEGEEEGRPDLTNAQPGDGEQTQTEGEQTPEQIAAAKAAKPGEKPPEGEEQGEEDPPQILTAGLSV